MELYEFCAVDQETVLSENQTSRYLRHTANFSEEWQEKQIQQALRPNQSSQLPAVITDQEGVEIVQRNGGDPSMAHLVFGAGLRGIECVRGGRKIWTLGAAAPSFLAKGLISANRY